jgi:uncharacterized protein (DUF934 family)
LARATRDAALLAGHNAPLGVLVPGETPPEALAPLLPWLALVAVRFPVFKDGRGFTLGRHLRERLGFTGALRATGHILPDQLVFLLRCGFSEVEIGDNADPAPWLAAPGLIRTAYQPVLTEDAPLGGLRRRLATAA